MLANARNPGSANYDGARFRFCPWCANTLQESEAPSIPDANAAGETTGVPTREEGDEPCLKIRSIATEVKAVGNAATKFNPSSAAPLVVVEEQKEWTVGGPSDDTSDIERGDKTIAMGVGPNTAKLICDTHNASLSSLRAEIERLKEENLSLLRERNAALLKLEPNPRVLSALAPKTEESEM